MPRRRFQEGSLQTKVPGNRTREEKPLPRGTYWAEWRQYVPGPDGQEKRRRREKIITKELARKYGIARDYEGPLTRTDAKRVLALLIAEDTGSFVPPDREVKFGDLTLEYIALNLVNWGPNMRHVSTCVIRKHLVNSPLGARPVAEVGELELQAFLNHYVERGSSQSLLRKLLLHIRGVFKLAKKKHLIEESPALDLKARSRKRPSERFLDLDECRRLLSELTGRDRLIVRILIQLGLRSEEVFVLRRDDLMGEQLRIDEALVQGEIDVVKTEASHAAVFLPPNLRQELADWASTLSDDPREFLFQSGRGRKTESPLDPHNFLNRVLKPAGVRAGIGIRERIAPDGTRSVTSDVNFQICRRSCATLFGDNAKDPRSTQAQLRHKDPVITLKTYQKAVPATVQAAAIALEHQLGSLDNPIAPTGQEQLQ